MTEHDPADEARPPTRRPDEMTPFSPWGTEDHKIPRWLMWVVLGVPMLLAALAVVIATNGGPDSPQPTPAPYVDVVDLPQHPEVPQP